MATHDPAFTLTTAASEGPAATSRDDDATLDDIYRALQRGAGRERVHDGNVEALIRRAGAQGDAQLELLLREWRSPCGDDPDVPSLPPSLPPPARQKSPS